MPERLSAKFCQTRLLIISNKRNVITHVAIIAFALLFLLIGNRIASQGMVIDYQDSSVLFAEARVIRIIDVHEEEISEWSTHTIVTFSARITSGEHKDKIIAATQTRGGIYTSEPIEIQEGDRVLLAYGSMFTDEPARWYYEDHVRFNSIIALGVIFVILLLLFGKIKGLNAVFSLGFTCLAIFAVFIPSILSGRNIYASAVLVCVFAIVVTLFMLNGINKKSFAAIAGCFGGVIAAGIITLAMNSAMQLTGVTDSESIHLLNLPTASPVDLRAIIFAGIIIGAVGAIMDVAVSISSALWELKEQAPSLTFSELFKSGINIGKDIMGSMTNTLVLAYIGSSLTIILLLVVYSDSLTELFNRELVIVEFLQALVGSLGILLTTPLTALICAVLYSRKQGHITSLRDIPGIEL